MNNYRNKKKITRNYLTNRLLWFLFFAIFPVNFSYAVSFMGKTSAKFSYIKSNLGETSSADIKSSVSNLSFDLNLVLNNGIYFGLSGDKDHLFQRSIDGYGEQVKELTSTLGFGINVGYWSSGFYAGITYLPVVSGKTRTIEIADSAGLIGQVGLAINLAGVIPGVGDWPYVGLGPSFRYKTMINQNLKSQVSSNGNSTTSGLSLMLDVVAVF